MDYSFVYIPKIFFTGRKERLSPQNTRATLQKSTQELRLSANQPYVNTQTLVKIRLRPILHTPPITAALANRLGVRF
jgi:hypothetical protein